MSRKPFHLLALAVLTACATPHEAQVSIPGAADAERALLASMHDVELAAATTGAGPAVGSPVALNAAPPHPELNTAVSLHMKAPLDDVARVLADKVGYRFSSNAVAGADPVAMEMDAQNVPVLDPLPRRHASRNPRRCRGPPRRTPDLGDASCVAFSWLPRC